MKTYPLTIALAIALSIFSSKTSQAENPSTLPTSYNAEAIILNTEIQANLKQFESITQELIYCLSNSKKPNQSKEDIQKQSAYIDYLTAEKVTLEKTLKQLISKYNSLIPESSSTRRIIREPIKSN